MRGWLAASLFAIALFAAVLGSVEVHAANRLEIRGFAGRVTIIPEQRANYAVGVIGQTARLPVRIRQSGDATIIDGGLARRIKGCPAAGEARGVRIRDRGFVALADLPSLVVRAPRDVRVSVAEGATGVVGRSDSLDLVNRGCGDWTIANVRGRLRLTEVGSGQLSVGSAGPSDVNVSGGGRITLRSVAGMLNAVSTGEGSVSVAEVDGPVVARIAGSGLIDILGGGAPELNAQVAGSGIVRFGGSAGAVTASVAGLGEVIVARASGPVSRRIFGSGRVNVGGDQR